MKTQTVQLTYQFPTLDKVISLLCSIFNLFKCQKAAAVASNISNALSSIYTHTKLLNYCMD